MSEEETPLSLTGSKALAAPVFVLPGLSLPVQVIEFLMGVLAECNRRISFQLTTFPNAHEEALDLMFISHFASMQGAIKFGSHWTVRIDAHFIGGGRHYQTWEVADIGLMAIFRRGGKIERSKLTFLQSKKLYASPLSSPLSDIIGRYQDSRTIMPEHASQDGMLAWPQGARPARSEQSFFPHDPVQVANVYGADRAYPPVLRAAAVAPGVRQRGSAHPRLAEASISLQVCGAVG